MASRKPVFDKMYWLIGYDLPAESRNGLTEDQETFLNTARLTVCRDLKTVFESYPVQQSIWVLREPDKLISHNGKMEKKLDVLYEYVEKWKADYAKNGFRDDVVMDIWPIQTTAVGQGYIEASAVKWLFDNVLDAEKRIEKYMKDGRVKIRAVNAMEGGLKWYREVFKADFGADHPRWKEFQDMWLRVSDKIDEDLRKIQVT